MSRWSLARIRRPAGSSGTNSTSTRGRRRNIPTRPSGPWSRRRNSPTSGTRCGPPGSWTTSARPPSSGACWRRWPGPSSPTRPTGWRRSSGSRPPTRASRTMPDSGRCARSGASRGGRGRIASTRARSPRPTTTRRRSATTCTSSGWRTTNWRPCRDGRASAAPASTSTFRWGSTRTGTTYGATARPSPSKCRRGAARFVLHARPGLGLPAAAPGELTGGGISLLAGRAKASFPVRRRPAHRPHDGPAPLLLGAARLRRRQGRLRAPAGRRALRRLLPGIEPPQVRPGGRRPRHGAAGGAAGDGQTQRPPPVHRRIRDETELGRPVHLGAGRLGGQPEYARPADVRRLLAGKGHRGSFRPGSHKRGRGPARARVPAGFADGGAAPAAQGGPDGRRRGPAAGAAGVPDAHGVIRRTAVRAGQPGGLLAVAGAAESARNHVATEAELADEGRLSAGGVRLRAAPARHAAGAGPGRALAALTGRGCGDRFWLLVGMGRWVPCNAVNYGTACFALCRFAARRCPAVADWIFGEPGGFSVFLCGQSRAFLLPRRT